MDNLEVLSPAGDIESLKVAILSGADAVYFGLNKFNARLKADNISLDNLQSIVDYAHLKGVKTYVTINTLVSDSELKELVEMVGECLNVGVDAFIVQDYGVIGVLKQVYPNIVLHGSTQLGVHNVRGARVAKQLGLTRVVLSREVTLDDIKEIRENVDIELEVFVQGAMCVCFSGNCYLSSLKFGASGNRGLCKQLCRLPYTLCDGKKKKTGYMISPRDNCMLDYLEDLCNLGVVSFKIEGRLRRSGYVSVATRNYRMAIDSLKSGSKFKKDLATAELKKVFSRGDYVSGYFNNKDIIVTNYNSHMGKKIGKVVKCERFKDLYKISLDIKTKLNTGDGLKIIDENNQIITLGVGNVENVGKYTIVYGKNYIKQNGEVFRVLDYEFENNLIDLSRRRQVKIIAKFVIGEPIELVAVCEDFKLVSVKGAVVQQAQKSPLQEDKIIENLTKWDKDIFEIIDVSFTKISDNIFVPISAINEARRELVDKLTEIILNSFKTPFVKCDYPQLIEYDTVLDKIAIIDEKCNVEKLKNDYSRFVLAPSVYSLDVIKQYYEKYKNILKGKFVINLPIIALSKDLKIIDSIVEYAIKYDIEIMANNIYALDYLEKGARIISSFNMNTTNRYAMNTLKKLGVEDIVFSCEKWTGRISGTYKVGSGRRVLMTMAHCPNVTLYGTGCNNVCGESCAGGCKYNGGLSLSNENNSYSIRRYKVYNCYFELLDEYREDSQANGVIDDLRN